MGQPRYPDQHPREGKLLPPAPSLKQLRGVFAGILLGLLPSSQGGATGDSNGMGLKTNGALVTDQSPATPIVTEGLREKPIITEELRNRIMHRCRFYMGDFYLRHNGGMTSNVIDSVLKKDLDFFITTTLDDGDFKGTGTTVDYTIKEITVEGRKYKYVVLAIHVPGETFPTYFDAMLPIFSNSSDSVARSNVSEGQIKIGQ